ncbi:hypothetical protein KEH51_01990 [[Brevibacterium] frigoritolerans]|uniref:SH3b domain-containing protein n=1 Tax=Peribacillus frigoritolerans TaxID=450367 RepID=A0A941J9N7_9BACI|nr:hypothetical protein [Peribacillus frigoritolerans]
MEKATASIVTILSKGTKVTVYSESMAGRKSKPMERMDMSTRNICLLLSRDQDQRQSRQKKTTTKYVNVSSGTLNMRKSGSESASIVAKLSKGTKVTMYSESMAGRKSKPMERMDMSTRNICLLLSRDQDQRQSRQKNDDEICERELWNAQYEKKRVGKCEHSRKAVKRNESDGVFGIKGWAKIKANGKDGYVSTKYLSTTKPGTGSTAVTPEKPTTKYVNVSSGTLNMRKKAGRKVRA